MSSTAVLTDNSISELAASPLVRNPHRPRLSATLMIAADSVVLGGTLWAFLGNAAALHSKPHLGRYSHCSCLSIGSLTCIQELALAR